MFNIDHVLIYNETEGRPAMPGEIETLIAEEHLFINYYIHGNDYEKGKAFIDIKDAEGFIVYYLSRMQEGGGGD